MEIHMLRISHVLLDPFSSTASEAQLPRYILICLCEDDRKADEIFGLCNMAMASRAVLLPST